MPTDLPLAEFPAAPDRDDGASDTGVTIVVCRSCRFPGEPEASPRPGAMLAAATRRAAAEGMTVKEAGCLGNCQRGLSAAILREGCWSYLFGGLKPDSADDLLSGAQLFARSPDRFMPYGARPASLKSGLIARIPSFDNLKDLP